MDENGRKRNLKAEATRWLIFFGVAIVLSVLLWLGLSLTGRKNPITSFGTLVSDSSVTVGIEGNAPKSLDIRTEQGTAVEQALLGNVYETLVSRSETNKLQPGIASSWQASDDGLTYTFTLNGGMTFANGHKLDSSDVVWSLQNAVNNHYVGADQLGDLKEITNPNANTVVITLAKPNPRLLRALAGRAGVVYDAESKTNYAKSAVGSGPFTVSTADQSQIVLQRNDSYWAKSRIIASDALLLRQRGIHGRCHESRQNQHGAAAERFNRLGTGQDQRYYRGQRHQLRQGDARVQQRQQQPLLRRADPQDDAIRHRCEDHRQERARRVRAARRPISPLEDGYEDLSGLYPYNLEQGQRMRTYFGVNYIAPIDILVPKEYESIGNDVKTAIENLNINTNLEVLDSAADVTERMNAGTYNIALTTMSDEGDASVFDNGQSVFHFENGDAQQAYANAMAATNDNDYQARMRDYARAVSENAASDWLYTRKNFLAVSDGLQGYPKNLTDRLLPLNRLTLH